MRCGTFEGEGWKRVRGTGSSPLSGVGNGCLTVTSLSGGGGYPELPGNAEPRNSEEEAGRDKARARKKLCR